MRMYHIDFAITISSKSLPYGTTHHHNAQVYLWKKINGKAHKTNCLCLQVLQQLKHSSTQVLQL